MSTLFPFAEKIAAWIVRHNRRCQQDRALVQEAVDRASAIYADEPMTHPEKYPDPAVLFAAQQAWEIRYAVADAAADGVLFSVLRTHRSAR